VEGLVADGVLAQRQDRLRSAAFEQLAAELLTVAIAATGSGQYVTAASLSASSTLHVLRAHGMAPARAQADRWRQLQRLLRQVTEWGATLQRPAMETHQMREESHELRASAEKLRRPLRGQRQHQRRQAA
jgi:hypothetical protein